VARIPFVGSSYTTRGSSFEAQRSLNMYLEYDQETPRAPKILYGRPGLDLANNFGSSPIRGMLAFQDYGMVVVGNQVWSAVYNGVGYTLANLGTIGTSSGRVGMAYNGTQVIIVDGVAGWLADLATLTQITSAGFPNGVTVATAQDGYFIVCGDGTQQFYINHTPGDGSTWNALDFGIAQGSPDTLIACKADHREVWMVGLHSIEVWMDTGNADFPFERNESAFIQIGSPSPWSVSALDNTLYWLGRDTNGHGIVYRAQGYSPVRISTHAVEHAILGYSTISDAYSYTFQLEGHSFFVLNFPTADATWAFDVSTNEWFEWGWRDPATGLDHRWRPGFQAFIGGHCHVGDWQNGKMYRLNLDTLTDNGDAIHRLRATQCIDSPSGHRNFYQEMRVDMESGTGSGNLSMRYSNDGGHTWSGYKTKALSAGAYATRVKWNTLGAGRNRVWEISTTDPIKWAVVGAYCDFGEGTA
jgi:hypothetical protein